MQQNFSRRSLLRLAGAAGVAAPGFAQRSYPDPIPYAADYVKPARVSLIHGEDRRKNMYDALKAIESDIGPKIKQKEYVVIKPNNVSSRTQLASNHADGLRGVLDFLEPYKKPVVIAESSGNPMLGFDNFGYMRLPNEYRGLNVKLVDLNAEKEFELAHIVDHNLHLVPVRLAKRLFDPDAFVLCAGVLKAHNTVVVTLSIKNMTLGAPLRSAPGETPRWNDKRLYHGGVRQTHLGILYTAMKMAPYWGATVLDGYEGMEGNGPSSGTPVDSRVAIASADLIAADRVGVGVMGIDPAWIGYLRYCDQAGLGQYDLDKIEIIGAKIDDVKKKYLLHGDIEQELMWMGPLEELPPRLG